MDLSVSPDLDARWCYLIVLLCGLISARAQLYKRFVDFKVSGAWLVPSTWLVFAIYLAIPIALFWLMDRMNALNDTSLFAALLVVICFQTPSGVQAESGRQQLRSVRPVP